MKSRLPAVLSICMLPTLVVSACAQTPEASAAVYPNVSMPGTEVRTLISTATGREYDIYVRISEELVKSGQKYPVLYVLDGQWDFKLLDSIFGGLYYDEFIPQIIIVGITYAGDKPDYDALRAMDYTPVASPNLKGSGDAGKFHTLLKEELFPFIEANYPVDPEHRMLLGSSFGGLFTLYAMFTEPELFDGYIAASPAVSYGDNCAFTQEAEYFAKRQDLPAKLYIAVGELEWLAKPVQDFMEVLKGRGYAGLEMETAVIAGERHASNKPEAYNRGLRYILEAKRAGE